MTATEQAPELLLIDDDPLIVDTLSFALQPQFKIVSAATRPAAIALLRTIRPIPNLALVDLGLPPTPHTADEGYALIGELLACNPRMKILILSGQSSRTNIQHALTLGAVDFVPKPCDAELLKARLAHQQLIADAELPPSAPGADASLLGDSDAMATLRELINQFGRMPFPVLIEGESGSGKELVAGRLHRDSERAQAPLVTINCAAFTPELLEAQLFGYRRGAFTGASDDHPGLFAEADRGTLFFDEIGEMAPELQIKFLRVLENGEYYRLGETQPCRSGARILAATNRDLRDAVRAGIFRADLYHRLSVLSLHVPPLRERGTDWQILLAHFQQQYADKVPPFRLDNAAAAVLGDYSFPGNVRELRNLVIRVGAKYPGRTVSASQIAAELEPVVTAVASRADDARSAAGIIAALQSSGFCLDDAVGDVERQYIHAALQLSDGNLSRAARMLGVNRTTLYSKVQRHGLAG